MSPEHEPDEIEKSRQSGEANAPLRRDDEHLLERLKREPPIKKQAPLSLTIGLIAVALALGVTLFFVFRKPETFSATTPALSEHTQQDSSELTSKRLHLAHTIDSLEKVIKRNPQDPATELALANLYYDAEYWDRALPAYAHYLDNEPNNVNARIDYAFVITQVSGDFKRAIGEIEKGLAVDPNHVQGLFNAGILSLRANSDNKETALKSARSYFTRAKDAAAKQGNEQMSSQIDQILKEMDKAASAPAPNP